MQKILKYTAAAIFWLIVWQAASMLINNGILLAGPIDTLRCLISMAGDEGFYGSILSSYLNIMLGIVTGSVLGIILGGLSYRYPVLETFLTPLVATIKAIPVASFIILVLIWAGNERVALVITALVTFPILYTGMRGGLSSADDKLLEMAHVYRMPPINRWRFIYFPSLLPFFINAVSLAVPMGFKSGVAAEVIGQPIRSMGNGLYRAKIYLETGELFAWTAVIILISFVTEKLLLFILSLFDREKGQTDDDRS